MAGVVAGSAELIGRIRDETYPYLGGKLSPFDAWLLMRGLRTLPIRMQAHEAAALDDRQAAAGASASSSAVCHPGLANRLPRRASPARPACSPSSFRDGVDIRALLRRACSCSSSA